MSNLKRAKLAVSSCLLGERVRYDGRHKRSDLIVSELSHYFDIVSICPETMMGLGIPRPPIIAIKKDHDIELIERESGIDLSERARETYQTQLKEIISSVHGFILKAKSPSCAIHPLSFKEQSEATQGYFAHAFQKDFPHCAFIDEVELESAKSLISFVLRVNENLKKEVQDIKQKEYDWLRLLANRLAA